MDGNTTRLFLVRHGETHWNVAKVFQGHNNSELTPAGIEQAARLAQRLEGEGITAIYSSDQGRAVQTATAVARRLGLTVIQREDIREINCGDWTGKQYDEVTAHWPKEHADWRERPHSHCMPNGESALQVQERALRFVREMQSAHRGRVVLAVTSNTVVRAVICWINGWPLARLWEGPKQTNCAINLIEMRDGKMRLIEAGDVRHLEGVPASAISFRQPPGDAV